MTKLIIAMLAGNCENTIEMSLKSTIKVADKYVIIYDTSSADGTYDILEKWKKKYPGKFIIIRRPYEHNFDARFANSNARITYLNYLKENFIGDWCLVLDADEVCDENLVSIQSLLKEYTERKVTLVSPRMIHFIGDLAHEDSTQQWHWVQNRLFKIEKDLLYPTGEHPVLTKQVDKTNILYEHRFVIYHLGYIPNLHYLKNRYKTHKAKSEIHSQEFLDWWYFTHISGQYPRKELDITTIPKIIKDEFEINDDWFYFKDRNIEYKHLIDAINWKEFFKCKTAIEFGCGKGPRVWAMNQVGINATGIEISEYAVKNKFHKNVRIGDVTKYDSRESFDLVIAYDLLEHIDYENLDKAIRSLRLQMKKHILISVPVIGDPNLELDPTHKIKETKEWWIQKIESHGIKVIPTPPHFLYPGQLIIGEVQNVA